MFQRHCTSLDAVHCFLDLFSVLRSLPQITVVSQQMERQDGSEQVNTGKYFDNLNFPPSTTSTPNILSVLTWVISATRMLSSRMRTPCFSGRLSCMHIPTMHIPAMHAPCHACAHAHSLPHVPPQHMPPSTHAPSTMHAPCHTPPTINAPSHAHLPL